MSGSLDVSLHLSLFICLPVCCLHLSPFLCFPVWLVVSVSLDVFLLVSLHLSPALPSGVRLSDVSFFAFTCLSSCVSRKVSPIYLSPFLTCFQSSVWICGGVRLFRLFAFACLPSVVSHQSYVFIMFLFVFRVCLCSFNPFASSCCLKIKSCSTFFFCISPLVSHPCLPLIVSDRIHMASQKIETPWHEKMLLVIHAVLT